MEEFHMQPTFPITLTQPELARLLALTPRQVRNLTGLVFRIVRKQGNSVFYPLPESVHAFIAYREHMVRKRCQKAAKDAVDLPT
jgi:hypothetical protein